ncbi:hypothetical protein IJJ12_02240 [bacterium]|nr:hypothetical protein [bacterium]
MKDKKTIILSLVIVVLAVAVYFLWRQGSTNSPAERPVPPAGEEASMGARPDDHGPALGGDRGPAPAGQRPADMPEPPAITPQPPTGAPEEAFMGYTPSEIAQATDVIMTEFQRFGEGFEMYSLDPLPERNTDEELAYINSLNKGTFTHGLVMASSFQTPASFEGITAWEPNTNYTYDWYLGRTDDTAWELVTYGY